MRQTQSSSNWGDLLRKLYSTPPAGTIFTDRRTGRGLPGKLVLDVFVYEPGESVLDPNPPAGVKPAALGRPLSAWRAAAGSTAGLRPERPSAFSSGTFVVPESVLSALPADATVRLIWNFQPEATP
jgi:hypothetical protein